MLGRTTGLVGVALVLVLAASCADEEGIVSSLGGGTPTGSATGAGGDPSTSASGQGPATTNSSSSSNSSSTGSGDDPATCIWDGEPLDPVALGFEPCECPGAHCVPAGLVGDPELAAQLTPCPTADEVCVPDLFIETKGQFIAETCASVGGFEGRCLSACIPQVAEQADLLPTDICAAGELCVPCYDPLSGESTGSCELSCDLGPVDPPESFAKCCEDLSGTCIPSGLIPPDQQESLGEDSCDPGAGALCVPDVLIEGYTPQLCETSFFIQTFLGEEYAEGGCMPECIQAVADAPFLSQGECADGYLCAPCLDPDTGQPSGACEPTSGI